MGQLCLAVRDGSLDTDGVELHIAVAAVVAQRVGGSLEVVSVGDGTSITTSVPAQPVGASPAWSSHECAVGTNSRRRCTIPLADVGWSRSTRDIRAASASRIGREK